MAAVRAWGLFYVFLGCMAGASSLSPGCEVNCETDCQIHCSRGFYFSHASCWECPTGFYCLGGSTAPQKCPAGTANLFTARGELSECQGCPLGYISVESGAGCKPCPVGYSCDPNTGLQSRCLPGEHSPEAEQSCTPCPEGYICPDGRDWKLCPAGQKPDLHRTRCLSCFPGFFTSSDSTACQPCLAGHFCADGTIANPCPAGTFGGRERMAKSSDCSPCPSGYYCFEGSTLRPGVESLCPEGFYCPTGTGNPMDHPCPAGTYNDQRGQARRESCIPCSEGLLCHEGSVTSGIPCRRGKFCPSGTSKEQSCPAGTFTRQIGASRIEQCEQCPAGYYCPFETSDPIPCPTGTFGPLEGQDDARDCRSCVAGSACTRPGLTQPDTGCIPGYVCPPGSQSPNAPDNACPPGMFSDHQDLFDKSQCDVCPARYFCTRGTGGKQRPPVPCPAGHYCPLGTKQPKQYKCPPGTWSDRTSLASETDCYSCPTGWFCVGGADIPSGKCSAGHYCPEGSQTSTQYPCPAGTFSTSLGNGRVGECHACPEGSYCLPGTPKPILCPVGTYRTEQGARTVEECDKCPAGSFCPELGTRSPKPCGTGRFSVASSAACSICLAGYYCSLMKTSRELMLEAMVCPAGFFCPEGLSVKPDTIDRSCPQGFYCPKGNIHPKPLPCPNGTYSDQRGLGSIEECTLCPAGKYCYMEGGQPLGITQPTGDCSVGYTCPPGTGFPQSFPCQPGYYWTETSAEGGDSCIQCPSGHYCDSVSMMEPKLCPAGFYCMKGSFKPEPCPLGTYSKAHGIAVETECQSCDGGFYCDEYGQTTPAGQCSAGFFCPNSTVTPFPAGGICTAGGYCPEGSAVPINCPPGTHSNMTGLKSASRCLQCPPGMFCDGEEPVSPTGPCRPGFFCTGASTTAVQQEVPPGHYSLEGASRAEACSLGTFQPLSGQDHCETCLEGTFCNQTSMVESFICPKGQYCPAGSIVPILCPAGAYADTTGCTTIASCKLCAPGKYCSRAGLSKPEGPCQAGYYCTQGSNTSSPVGLPFGDLCPAGYYCPMATQHPHEKSCPPGTWNPVLGAQDLTWCQPCPSGTFCDTPGMNAPAGLCSPGFYCAGGAQTSRPQDGLTGDLCPRGHFCPEGSTEPTSCPEKTYSNTTGQARCSTCPRGYNCLEGIITPCPPGFYCPETGEGSRSPCPPGSYNPGTGLSLSEECLKCPGGMFCADWGLHSPSGPCEAGYFCVVGSISASPDGVQSEETGGPCPAGYYCPSGTSVPLPCPAGTYNDRMALSREYDCTPCTSGYYCSSPGLLEPSGPCPAGFYCPSGIASPSATTPGFRAQGWPCPVGHYCPMGTNVPLACPAGTYNNLSHQFSCSPCPAGYYCPENTTNYDAFPCPPGFYCPSATNYASQYPCPRGFYNPDPLTQSLDSCLPCPPGHYCGKENLTTVSGKCDPGWFCVFAAWTPQPFDLDNYTSDNCLCPATATGGKCLPGTYCPEGSSEPILCLPGTFCNQSGLSAPSGECTAGFYCGAGSSSPTPTDGIAGNICPPGTVCTPGSHVPTPCPPGTFSGSSGASSLSACQLCVPGFYCERAGLSMPSGQCAEGYYCPEGQIGNTSFPCPVGHRCPIGSDNPIACPSGFYQKEQKQSLCQICEAGFYCDGSLGPVSDFTPFPCPPGFYCPPGTLKGTQYSCPSGTFGPGSQRYHITECQLCSAGKYCDVPGLAAPTGNCSEGYWCKGGATEKELSDTLTQIDCPHGNYCPKAVAGPCPPGHYCPEGTAAPVPCPAGTYSTRKKLSSETHCSPCLPGHYCDTPGLIIPSGRCLEGFYCVQGSSSPSFAVSGMAGGPCPKGHFCPYGSAAPQTCSAGTYSPDERQAACLPCVRGFFCPDNTSSLAGKECLAGHYCPVGTTSGVQFPCPAGTYNPRRGSDVSDHCIACEPGHYCKLHGQATVTGPCSTGYYCTAGATTPTPSDGISGNVCPYGHYCPMACISPQPCPPGTYSNMTGNADSDDCLLCDPGHFCNRSGLAASLGLCDAGFYCSRGSNSSRPMQVSVHGGPCPPGHFCRIGSSNAQQCPGGSFAPDWRLEECWACPEGTYCESGVSRYSSCPTGHYCPQGTKFATQYPCPLGTYSEDVMARDASVCQLCPPGKFCSRPGLASPEGLCAPGWFCLAGSTSQKPVTSQTSSDSETGTYLSTFGSAMCPKGTFCPAGSSVPISCTPGYYCTAPELAAVSGPCNPGYYCSGGSSIAKPEDGIHGNICPAGHYCPSGSAVATPCPPGSFQTLAGSHAEEDCQPCIAGWYCSHWGQASPQGLCDGGWFCPLGSITPHSTDNFCPVGHFCPSGSKEPQPCPAGQYQDQRGQISCKICPAGMFCGPMGQAHNSTERSNFSLGVVKPLDCPTGYYCLPGSQHGLQSPCPEGTYSDKTGLINAESCQPCPGGTFCSTSGLCFPGYYCTLRARLPNPPGDGTGDRCPAGHFCPAGSSVPSPCTPGTFQPSIGMISFNACLPCPAGKFCQGEGLLKVSGDCAAGFYCLSRASVESPVDGLTGGLCPKGRYCPPGAASPIPCASGFYQLKEGQSSCYFCPAGFYCGYTEPRGVVTPQPCPPGHYCPKGSETGRKNKCPRGTVSAWKQLTSAAECNPCPAGFYCALEGLREPSGRCLPGYWCIQGANRSNPTDGVTGRPCPLGKFCVSGLLSGDCSAGFFCDFKSTRPDQKLCPPGFFCPAGTEAPVPCEVGSYSPLGGKQDAQDCQACPAGYFCDEAGKTAPRGQCTAGFFCPPGQMSASPAAFLCPVGFYCPAGSSAPTPCEGGTFRSQRGGSSCSPCPEGSYCKPTDNSSGVQSPKLCPAGFYCPLNSSQGTGNPCPVGTYGTKMGSAREMDCTPCPPGMFCSTPGLTQPSGICNAGHYCSSGATNPTPMSLRVGYSALSAPGNDICPAGSFCPAGSRSPVPCPLGSYSAAPGLAAQEQCLPCPAGRYCDQVGLKNLSQAGLCAAGFVCLEGSTSPCPSDGINGYKCPPGFYCPKGSGLELPCAPGTFSPMAGADICLACSAGTSCGKPATVEPARCPSGYYCPVGTTEPLPCPEGTLNPMEGALSTAACKQCPAGMYCRGPGNREPDGPCAAGYYCQGGATDVVPQKTPTFPLSGPCPVGHYCPEGTATPMPCLVGSLNNATGGLAVESCVPCTAGFFCASVGLSSPTGPCAIGFYCPANFTSFSPTAFLCPKGYFCKIGSARPVPCPIGQYQPNSGAESCLPCQPGFHCAVAEGPAPCPAFSYCPAGAAFPLPCPDGTSTPNEMVGLKNKWECLPCPAGYYCRGGRRQGPCAAGHFCLAGSWEFTPQSQHFNLSSAAECHWGQMCAGVCPPGFFCEEGSASPTPCPAHTLRALPGGRHREDCLTCPPRRWCRQGEPISLPCPTGHYCSGVNHTDQRMSGGPQPCPVHTYRAKEGAERAGDCQPCPPGYHCQNSGLADFEGHLCALGYWCPGNSNPILCPAGTFRSRPGGASLTDCEVCPHGYYCPDPALTGEANVKSLPCRPAYECPKGSFSETVCRAGSYCPPRTGIPLQCPGGYVCPEGSSTYNTSRQLCLFPFYCPLGSTQVLLCDGGHMALQGSWLRDSFEKTCRICEAGTYQPSANAEIPCQPCPPGYSCPKGVESYHQHVCPAGYYCPPRSATPRPCTSGTYGNSSQASHAGECYPCPAGTFNHLIAQTACFPCGSSSSSQPGSTSCQCHAQSRVFQESDGSCICQAGFVYYDERGQMRSDTNGDLDCQPQVVDRCGAGEVRLASTRKCTSVKEYDCSPFCGLLGGELSPDLGVCHCSHYISAEELCDTHCLVGAPRISMRQGHNKEFLLHVEEGGQRRSAEMEVLDILGPEDRVWSSERVHLALFSSTGVFGVIVSSTQVLEAFISGESWLHLSPRKRRSEKQASPFIEPQSIPRIPNPVVCLNEGDVILFQLSIFTNNRSYSHYPVYQKQHLFNSNPNWDFGAFRRLDHLIRETNLSISWFAHVFHSPGSYVFIDNGVEERSLIVVVNERDVACDPVTAAVQPSAPYQLVRHGILKQRKLNLAPNWVAITVVLIFLALLLILLLIVAVVLRPAVSEPNPLKNWKPRWRSLGAPHIPPQYILTKDSIQFYESLGYLGSGDGADLGKSESSAGAGVTSPFRVLEDFNVRTLYDKLEDQSLHIASQLGRHRSDTLAFYRGVSHRIQVLKEMLQGLDSPHGSGLERYALSAMAAQSDQTALSSGQSNASTRRGHQDIPEFSSRNPDSPSQEAVSLIKILKILLLKITSDHSSSKREKRHHAPNGTEKSCSSREKGEDRDESIGKEKQTKTENRGNFSHFQQTDFCGKGLPSTCTCHALQPPCTMMTFGMEIDLERWIACSPLYRTLTEIKQALEVTQLQDDPVESLYGRPEPDGNTCILESERESQLSEPWSEIHVTLLESDILNTVDLDTLTPHEFVVYRFGCEIIRLLCRPYAQHPPVLLLPERTIDQRVLLSSTSSLYDARKRFLYIQKEHLENVGKFVVIIVHSLARIQAEHTERSDQTDILKRLNSAIQSLSLALFNSSWRVPEEERDEKELKKTPEAWSAEGKSLLKQWLDSWAKQQDEVLQTDIWRRCVAHSNATTEHELPNELHARNPRQFDTLKAKSPRSKKFIHFIPKNPEN